jgi:hypothetical protein
MESGSSEIFEEQRDRVSEKARKTSKQGKKARESTVSGDPLTQRAI